MGCCSQFQTNLSTPPRRLPLSCFAPHLLKKGKFGNFHAPGYKAA
jgi:hypothetical protein